MALQHAALSREERESGKLLPMGSWAVPGELQCAPGERPKQALGTSAMVKQGPDGQSLASESHLLSGKKSVVATNSVCPKRLEWEVGITSG